MSSCPVCNKEFDTSRATYRDGMLVCSDCIMAEKPNLEEEIDLQIDELFGDTNLTKREVMAFLGNNESYYLKKWEKASSSGTDWKGWNWVAFFLPVYWLAYRRMYRNTAIFFIIVVVAQVALDLLGLKVVRVVSLIAKVILGAYGNGFYYKHMIRKTGEQKIAKFMKPVELFEISSIGGTSIVGVGVIIFIEVILAVMAVIAYSL